MNKIDLIKRNYQGVVMRSSRKIINLRPYSKFKISKVKIIPNLLDLNKLEKARINNIKVSNQMNTLATSLKRLNMNPMRNMKYQCLENYKRVSLNPNKESQLHKFISKNK